MTSQGPQPSPDPQSDLPNLQSEAGNPKFTFEDLASFVKNELSAKLKTQEVLSAAGILTIARELPGFFFQDDQITSNNLAMFKVACARLNQPLLAQTLAYAAAGHLALAEGELPTEKYHQYVEPIQAYLGAIQFLNVFCDHTASDDAIDEAFVAYWSNSLTPEFSSAINAADRVEFQLVSHLIAHDAPEAERGLGSPHLIGLQLHDITKARIAEFSSVPIKFGVLGEDPQISNRPIFSPNSNIQPTTNLGTLRSKLFTSDQYPDQSVVDRASVKHVAIPVPMPKNAPELLFTLTIDGSPAPYSLEIISGNVCHTYDHRRISEVEGIRLVSMPSQDLDGEQRLFKLYPADVENGFKAQLTSSIVLITKPQISRGKAYFRQDVIRLQQGKIQPNIFALGLKTPNPERDSLEDLVAQGWMSEQVKLEVETALNLLTSKRRPIIRDGLGLYDDGDKLSFGSYLQGKPVTPNNRETLRLWMSNQVENLLPDPFTPPIVTVIYPFGVCVDTNIQGSDIAAALIK